MISIRDELLVNQSGEMSSQMGLLVGKIQTLEKEKLEAVRVFSSARRYEAMSNSLSDGNKAAGKKVKAGR